ncbi:MAG: hypothetical protein WAX89_01290 [Alphaproteobacteria bacterium]
MTAFPTMTEAEIAAKAERLADAIFADATPEKRLLGVSMLPTADGGSISVSAMRGALGLIPAMAQIIVNDEQGEHLAALSVPAFRAFLAHGQALLALLEEDAAAADKAE